MIVTKHGFKKKKKSIHMVVLESLIPSLTF